MTQMRQCLASLANFVKEGCRSLCQPGKHAACDGMRALSLIWICSFHAVKATDSSTRIMLEKWWFVSVLINGDIGVDIFLTLSGFLLGGALYQEYQLSGSMKFGSFYIKRWFRIVPAYISTILLTIVVNQPSGTRNICLQDTWTNLVFINNFTGGCLGHTWSIATEFQLYAFTPPLFAAAWFLSRRRQWSFSVTVLTLCSTVYLVCLSFRVHFALQHLVDPGVIRQHSAFGGYEDAMPYTSAIFRMAPYAAGLCGGVAVTEQTSGKWGFRFNILQSILAVLSSIILVLAALFGGIHMREILVPLGAGRAWQVTLMLWDILSRPLVGLATSCLLYLCATGEAPKLQAFLTARIWTPMAGLSYSMYLLQYSGMQILLLPIYDSFLEGRIAGTVGGVFVSAFCMPVLAMLGTLPLALLNFVFVERIGIMLGQRLLSRIQSAKTSGTAAKLGEPTPADAATKAIPDLESGSTTPTDAGSESISSPESSSPISTDVTAENMSELESGITGVDSKTVYEP